MKEFSYEIKEHLATLSTVQGEKREITLELNLISFGDRPAKYDLRTWDRTNGKLLKGVTLTREEAEALQLLITSDTRDCRTSEAVDVGLYQYIGECDNRILQA